MTTTISSPYLLKSLALANEGRGFCAPNPAVGAVIVDTEGKIVATGYHTGPGKPHAEIDALKKISHQAQGMTIYVTLEPCCHFGKTPPCTDALIQAGIKKVIYGYRDPNPIVSGQGEKKLLDACIICEHIVLPEIDAFYQSYSHWHATKKPFITAKIALSLDGKIAGINGERIQLTGDALQLLTHEYRKASDAILTTVQTIKNDDPKLNARCQNKIFAKPIYVLDSELSLSTQATIFKTAAAVTIFYDRTKSAKNFEQSQIRCIPVETNETGLNLQQVIQQIGQDGMHDLWVEAGGKCFSSFLKAKLLQRALIYIAPKWLTAGHAAFDENFNLMDFNPQSIQWQQVGEDVVLDIRF